MASPAQQAAIQMDWVRNSLPSLYPGITKNSMAYASTVRQALSFRLPPKAPDEDSILLPNTFNMDNFTSVERNPAYAKKSYADQQVLKSIWFGKTSVADRNFQALPPDKQQAFYNNLMRRGPAMSTGILPGYSPEEVQRDFESSSKAMQVLKTIGVNLFTSFGESLTDLFTGPARLLSGDNSVLAHALDDIEKNREWYNAVSESNDFLTKTLPSLVGTGAGFAIGPWGFAGRALEGGYSLAKGAKTAEELIKLTPGLLEKGGLALGAKLPTIGYQVGSEALTGAAWTIADNLSKGQPWQTGMAGNIGIAAGLGFATRYVKMFGVIRKAATELGFDPKHASEIFREPFQAGSGRVLTKEMEALLKANPAFRGIFENMYATDKNGFLLRNMYTPQGVNLRAEILGFRAEDDGKVLRIFRNRGGVSGRPGDPSSTMLEPTRDVLQTFDHGDLGVRIDKAHNWLDNQVQAGQEAIVRNQPGKQFSEVINTMMQGTARKVTFVPDKARGMIADFLNLHGVQGFDYRLNPNRESLQQMDDLFQVLRVYKSVPKAEAALKARGILFDTDPKVNRATVKQLQGQLDAMLPHGTYLVVDKADPSKSRLNFPSGNWMPGVGSKSRTSIDINVPHQDVPRVALEAPDKYEPTMTDRVLIGNPAQLRSQLELLSRMGKNMETQARKQAKGLGVSYRKFLDSQVVEIQVPMRDAHGNEAVVTLHSPSTKDALQLLSTGVIDSKEKFAGHFFADNPELQKLYDDYLKRMKSSKGQGWVDRNWMPFQYVAAQAKQNNWFLGEYRGKYVLQDTLTGDPSWRTFNTLSETIGFLNSKESRIGRPDFAEGVMTDAVKELYPNISAPLSEMKPAQLPQKRLSIVQALLTKIAPSGWTMERMANLKAVQESGADPVAFINNLTQMSQARSAFNTQWSREQGRILTGVKQGSAEAKTLRRWVESLDQPALGEQEVGRELRKDVEAEMERTFGKQRSDQLISIGTNVQKYFNDLWSYGGDEWTKWVKGYFPHFRTEAAKYGGGGNSYVWNKVLGNVPKADRPFFFEFTRVMDPTDMGYVDDIHGMMQLYTHMMGKKVFQRPIAKMLGNQLREIASQYRAKGAVPKDYDAYHTYAAQILESVGGLHSPTERITQTAWANTTDELGKRFKALFGMNLDGTEKLKQAYSGVQIARTITVGGQLGARAYPVIRDLLSAFASGAPTLGIRSWMKGLDRMLQPGAMEEIYRLGMAAPGNLPVAGAEDIITRGYGKVVTASMAPYKWSVDMFRGITYFAARSRAEEALGRLNSGLIDGKKFIQESGANLWGRAEQNYLMKLLNTGKDPRDVNLFVHEVAKLATGRVHAIYDTFQQPSIFRSSIGKLLGQYTTYPINYANLILTRITSNSMTFGQKAKFLAELSAVTGALVYGAESVGVNPRHWIPWDVAMFQTGPYFQLLNDMGNFLHGDRTALRNVAQGMASMVPFALESGGLSSAYQAMQDGDWWEAFVHLIDAPAVKGAFPKRTEPVDVVVSKIQSLGNAYLKAQGYIK